MAHGGSREGAGRKPRPDPGLEPSKPGPVTYADRACYARIIAKLNAPEPKEGVKAEPDTPEVARFRKLVDAHDSRIVLDTLKWLYDKRDGKAIQPVDVDANLDSNVTIHLGSLMPKEFREKPSAPARGH